MRKLYTTILVLLISVSGIKAQVKIIFDTDLGGDFDDLGALAMLHHFVDKGECDLLAVMCWSTEQYAVSAIDAVNRFYQHPDIPVGVRKGPKAAFLRIMNTLTNKAMSITIGNKSSGSRNAFRVTAVRKTRITENIVQMICIEISCLAKL